MGAFIGIFLVVHEIFFINFFLFPVVVVFIIALIMSIYRAFK